MTDIVAIIVNGLVYGSIYGLVAIGMTLIYGTLRILDMSQGSMVMIGGYVGWWALATHGVNPLLALVLAFVVTFVVGTLTELVSVQPLIGRRGEVDFEMVTFITTFAVGILLTNVALQHFGPFQKNVPPIVSGNLDVYHGVSISYHELTMAGVSVLLMGALGLFLARTRWGFAVRAVAQDLDAARSLGVPVSRLYPATMGLASALAGVGGVFLGALYFASPTAGDLPLLQALIVVVLGGRQSHGHPLRRVPGGADAGLLRGRDRHHLDASDPVHRDPDHPGDPALRPQGQPLGGAALTGTFSGLSPTRWLMIGSAIVLVALFPLVYTDPYYMTIIVTAEVVLILNISWNFVLGMAGVWNFGQLAIYALGAYGAGWLMLHQTWMPAMIAILCGGLFSAVISVLLAFPTLRLFGIYTSLLTFSFAQVVQYVALNDPRGLTGGSYGYPTVPGLFPNMSQTSYLRAYYWVFAAVIVASCLVVAWLRQSHLGIALRSIRDSPGYTAARGVNPRMTRVIAFGLSGFLAGVAGGFYLSFEQSFTTSQMGLTPMSIDVTMLVIGGLGTVMGPVIGTAIVTVIQTILIDYPGWQLTILGATLLVIVIFVPGGVVGLISRTSKRVSAWVEEDSEAVEPAET